MGDAGEDAEGSLLVVRPARGPRFGDAPLVARGFSADFVVEESADDGVARLARPLLIGLSPETSEEADLFEALGEFAEDAGDAGELLPLFGDIVIIGMECTPAFSAYGS